MSEEIPLRPVVGWDLHKVPALGVAMLTFRYLVSPMESAKQAHRSHNFGLTPAQLRDLARSLEAAAQVLETELGTPPGALM